MKVNRYYLAIFLLFLGLFTFQFSMVISYVCQLTFLLLYFPWIVSHFGKFILNKYNLFFGFFLVWFSFSILWAPNKSFAIAAMISVVQIFLYSSLIFNRLRNDIDFEKIISYLGIAIFLSGIAILLLTSTQEWHQIFMQSTNASSSQGRLGPSVSMHPNELAEVLLTGTLISFFLFLTHKKKRYLIIIAILGSLLFFTKSRTSLVLMLFCFVLLYVLNLRKNIKILMAVPAMLVFITLILWLIQHNPYLYNLVGFRFAGIFDSNGIVDASTRVRNEMIQNAIQLFKEHPFLGVGINNFRYYAVSRFNLFAEVYAHNNYVEVLSTTGLIGFVAYYFPIVYSFEGSLKEIIKNSKKTKPMYFLVFTLIMGRLIGDVSRVSYSLEIAQITNMFCFAWVYYNKGGNKAGKEVNSI